MISTLRGQLIQKSADMAVIDCGGIGYQVKIPITVSTALPEEGHSVQLRVTMILSKSDISLVGFMEEQQEVCFRLLLGVSGCGIKSCLAILGALTPGQLYRAVADGDAAAIAKIKGVGKKLSQRVTLELRDKIKAFAQEELPPTLHGTEPSESQSARLAIAALENLGYRHKEAAQAVSKVDSTMPVDKIITTALKAFLA